MRIPPGSEATSATIEQIRRLIGLLPEDGEVPLFVLDAGYDPIATGHNLAGDRAEVLCRIRDDRVFYADPPPRPNRPPEGGGRPPRRGKRWKCSEPATWTTPADSLVATDPRYRTVTVTAWHVVHPRLLCRGHWSAYQAPPIVKGNAIRVEVEHLPRPTGRTKKTLWLWWSGEGEPDLGRRWRAYLRRFDIEHGFRFVRAPSAGPRRRSARLSRRAVGPGSSLVP